MIATIWALSSILLSGVPASPSTGGTKAVHFRGTARIKVPPVWSESYKNQRAELALTPTGERAWTLDVASEGYHCSVAARGPREALTITPGQTCKIAIRQPKLRGSAVVTFREGSVRQDKAGKDQLTVRAVVDAQAEQRVQRTVFGQAVDLWVPLPIPQGSASYTSTSTRA